MTSPSSTPGTSSQPSSARRVIVAGVILAVGGGGYAVGRLQGSLSLSALNEQHREDRSALEAQVEAANARTNVCYTERDLLHARHSLALVALALEKTNFGTAEARREEAVKELGRPTIKSVPGIDALLVRVAELKLSVDPDPGAKRAEVIEIIQDLDRIIAAEYPFHAP